MTFTDIEYPDTLDLRWLHDDEWSVLTEFRCRFHRNGGPKETITVPIGFINDLASIPQIFQNIVTVVGPQNLPSVIHDWCYENRWRTRKESDDLFLAGLAHLKVSWLKRNAMYAAVRIGGRGKWED